MAPAPSADDCELRARLREIAKRKPRWGYRRAHAQVRQDGHRVNRKRVQRLWREEGLRVPQKTRKRVRTADSDAKRLRAQRPNELWALDYEYDQTADGRMLRLLNIVDEFTREALAMHVDRSITAEETVSVLEDIVARRGCPANLRCDNGPELTAHALRDWCASADVTGVSEDLCRHERTGVSCPRRTTSAAKRWRAALASSGVVCWA